ncbi:MAG: metallophosphoesterase family protein [Propionibacteriaceae bacterium]|nr:metallophosphoesterase family protein [Propionibacteriaceae bacterium]
MKTSTLLGPLLGSVAMIGAGCVAYGALVESRSFRLRRVHAPVLPPGHAPIRILHLSDLHLMTRQASKIAWVRDLAQLRPDLVVNTGDNVASPDALAALARCLTPFAGTPGVFVLGSNDLYASRPINPLKYLVSHEASESSRRLPTKALTILLSELGWENAEGRSLSFSLKGSSVEVRGCGDAHIDLDEYPVLGPTTADLLIGVTHAPYRRVLDQMAADQAHLIMAGHTHGGQVCLPGGRALTTNCDLPTAQARGLSTYTHGPDTAYLHVSAGLGTSPYAPYRFACPPEATLLTAVARSEE